MSGGHFDYIQSRLEWDVIDKIERIVENNKKERPAKELYDRYRGYDDDWLEKYPEDKLYSNWSDETMEEFKKGINIIKQAYVYIQRIDWLLSGDDGEETFHERLKEDLNENI